MTVALPSARMAEACIFRTFPKPSGVPSLPGKGHKLGRNNIAVERE